jgi:hypothetical protein
MAELIGALASGITLAGLFKMCIEAFDLVQTGRHQRRDLRKLVLRLNIEKCRLYKWGQSMGLTEITSGGSSCLDKCQFVVLIREALKLILELFHDTQKIQLRYGCKQNDIENTAPTSPDPAPNLDVVETLALSFSNFRIEGPQQVTSQSINVARKTRWQWAQ